MYKSLLAFEISWIYLPNTSTKRSKGGMAEPRNSSVSSYTIWEVLFFEIGQKFFHLIINRLLPSTVQYGNEKKTNNPTRDFFDEEL